LKYGPDIITILITTVDYQWEERLDLKPGFRIIATAAVLACIIAGWGLFSKQDFAPITIPIPVEKGLPPSPVESIPADQLKTPDLILLGARAEAVNGTRYDASYQVMSYPGGDVAPDRGACTDVVIRAFRRAGIDLQALIHQDMRDRFSEYPQLWGLKGPDANIDHRRVPNQMAYFKRHGQTLSVENHSDETLWQWGDVVYWRFSNGLEHCGIVSDRRNEEGIPLVIHNASVCREEDALLRWEIIGHYRYPK
jgi:hypothetical protein